MKIMNRKSIVTLVFALVSSLAMFGQNKCLDQMLWLEGKWEGKLDSQLFVEDWKQMNGQLIGKGYLLSSINDTVSTEDLFINCNNNGTIDYAASPTDDYFITFVANEDIDKKSIWIFENPENDFPKKITYQKLSAKEIKIIVSDDKRSFTYNMKKIN